MKKSNKKDQLKRFIRFDKHLERLSLSGYTKEFRTDFGYPTHGFQKTVDYETWQMQNLWKNKAQYEKWNAALLYATVEIAKLPEQYKKNVELYLALDFIGVYPVEQPGLPHHRTDTNYLRAKKITKLYEAIDPDTGEKMSAAKVAEMYQPNPEAMEGKRFDRWTNKYGVGSAEAIRKIVSKYKKSILK